MEISKCIRCKGFYQRVKSLVCPKCEIEEEREIFQVRQYMRDHPGSTLDEISDGLNIYLEDIDRWIEEKRLHVDVGLISEKKDVVQKLYDSLKVGVEEETMLAQERLKPNTVGNSGPNAGAGKYRRG